MKFSISQSWSLPPGYFKNSKQQNERSSLLQSILFLANLIIVLITI